MNNIYVSELPKICVDCPCEYEYYCNVCNCELNTTELYEKRPADCPLKPLTDRLAEERKKVVQEIDCELYTKMVVYGDAPSYTDIHSILNKIKENNV